MTTHWTLPEPKRAFRIGDSDGEHPIWSSEGAWMCSGRWHVTGASVIYASEHYSTAMLEKLVHYNGGMPSNQHFLQITIPAGTSYEVASGDLIEGWASSTGEAARKFGQDWHDQKRSAILIVPSVVARMENNILFNAAHDEFAQITISLEAPIWWDDRLFG